MTEAANAPVGEYERSIARQELVKWICLNRFDPADACMYGPNGCSCVERFAQVLANIRAAERATTAHQIGHMRDNIPGGVSTSDPRTWGDGFATAQQMALNIANRTPHVPNEGQTEGKL